VKTRSFFLAIAVLFSFPVLLARAQYSKDFSTVRFYPAPGSGNYIGVEGANVTGNKTGTYGAFFDFSANTLVVDHPCSGIRNGQFCENEKVDSVAATGLVHMMGAFSIANRVQLSLDIPLGFTDAKPFYAQVRTDDDSSPNREWAPGQGFAFADARLAAKTRLLGTPDAPFGLAITAYSTLPTAMITSNGDCRKAGTCSFTGERGVNAGAYLIAEYRVRGFRTSANAGIAYRPERRFLTEEAGTELIYGAGARYDITPLVHVRAEAAGFVGLVAKDYPIEVRGAFSYGRDFVFMLGGGAGLHGDVGSPSYRVFAGGQYTPVRRDLDKDGIVDEKDGCPSEPEDRDNFADQDGCPEPDNDGDGIFDATDACDNEREDMDGFADEDGCPELDNDGDGVQDGYDSCEGQKEDIDGDRDDDGCPDFDTDRDGIRDDLDSCPDAPEDTDGLADEDGCPEADYDGDGLKDPDDACPDQPESWNGIMDSDGCPEDDSDGDTVPDQVDACEEQAETLNGVKDADGCPDGPALIERRGQALTSLAEPSFDGDHLTNEKALVAALADFIKRNHKRGSVRVVLFAPETAAAPARAAALAKALEKRINQPVASEHKSGAPARFEVELLSPGQSETPAPKPASAPKAQPAAPSTPAAPIGPPAPPAKAGAPAPR
jgi:OmpA-OmpF porin, OOP family